MRCRISCGISCGNNYKYTWRSIYETRSTMLKSVDSYRLCSHAPSWAYWHKTSFNSINPLNPLTLTSCILAMGNAMAYKSVRIAMYNSRCRGVCTLSIMVSARSTGSLRDCALCTTYRTMVLCSRSTKPIPTGSVHTTKSATKSESHDRTEAAACRRRSFSPRTSTIPGVSSSNSCVLCTVAMALVQSLVLPWRWHTAPTWLNASALTRAVLPAFCGPKKVAWSMYCDLVFFFSLLRILLLLESSILLILLDESFGMQAFSSSSPFFGLLFKNDKLCWNWGKSFHCVLLSSGNASSTGVNWRSL